MKHSEILPRLAAYHDGQLGPDERLEIQAHLEQCSECQHLVADWKTLDSALVRMPALEIPVELYERTQQALAGVRTESRGPRRVYMRMWMAAAAVFVVAFAGTLWWQSKESERTDIAVSLPPTEVAKPEQPAAPVVTSEVPANAERSMLSGHRALAAQTDADSKANSNALYLDEFVGSTAAGPVETGDTGIPQLSDWPARLTDAEFSSLVNLRSKLKFRVPPYTAPLEVAEINLMPYFDDAFVAVGYKTLSDPLNPGHEAAYSDPILLTPETAYLVSNLRLEQAAMWARSQEQVPNAETAIKLAEITWRLANLTADRDDVKGAIAAHTVAMQQRPDWARTVSSRLTTLKALDKP